MDDWISFRLVLSVVVQFLECVAIYLDWITRLACTDSKLSRYHHAIAQRKHLTPDNRYKRNAGLSSTTLISVDK